MARKDNFKDRVMSGWQPSVKEQIAYENHRSEYERKNRAWIYNIEDELVPNPDYVEQDVDWDFETNAPREVKENS